MDDNNDTASDNKEAHYSVSVPLAAGTSSSSGSNVQYSDEELAKATAVRLSVTSGKAPGHQSTHLQSISLPTFQVC